MESITATERELLGLMETGFFVRSEPVKKGEYLGVHPIEGTPCILVENDEEMVTIIVQEIGDVYPVKNKKGEKQWVCPTCKTFEKEYKFKNVFTSCPNFDCKGHKGKQVETRMKPLLVRLDKIEEQIVFSVEKHYFETDLKNPDNRYCSRYRHLKKGVNFKPKVNQEVWLQNFRRIE